MLNNQNFSTGMSQVKRIILISCVIGFFFFLNAPIDFPLGTIIKIEPGESLKTVSSKLKTNHIIRSQIVFEAFVIIFGGEKRVISSNHYFENKLPVYEVARRIWKGEHHIKSVAITIPEGFNTAQIGFTFASKLPYFSESGFLLEAKDLEGRLFPDTYFFLITDNEKDVLKSMNENFKKKMLSLQPEITLSGKTEKDIIIMASLVEGEAKGEDDREFISGILWRRLAIGMPLQVDISPETYKTKGLPENPVGNPGLLAIKATIFPKKSPYLYYLHDEDGNIHYAKTFEEHKLNKLKYLNR